MLLIIIAVAFAATLTLAIITYSRCEYSIWHLVSELAALFTGAMLIIALAAVLITHLGLDGERARLQRRYEDMTYQYVNGFYENDNDVGKKELVKEITDWNEELAKNKVMQRDTWLGPFIPNIFDEFDFIELVVDLEGE